MCDPYGQNVSVNTSRGEVPLTDGRHSHLLFKQGTACSCERSILTNLSTDTLNVHLQLGESQMNIRLVAVTVLAAAFVFVSDMAVAKSNQLTDSG